MKSNDLSLLLDVLAQHESQIKRVYQGRLNTIASRFDADDMWAEVQLRAIRDWDKCESRDAEGVKRWVRVIARNTTLTALSEHVARDKRSVLREVNASSASDQEFNQIENAATHYDVDQVELEELLLKCRNAVDKLPSRQAKAIQRRYLDDVDYDVIATEMAVSVGAARTLVSRGIASCREQVAQF